MYVCTVHMYTAHMCPRNVHSKMFTVLSIDKDVYLESGTL